MAGSFLSRVWPSSLASAIGRRIDVIPNGYQELEKSFNYLVEILEV